MFVSVRADTRLSWVIDYDDGCGRQVAGLRLKDGAWYLTRRASADREERVGDRRIQWPEAVKRALIALAPQASD